MCKIIKKIGVLFRSESLFLNFPSKLELYIDFFCPLKIAATTLNSIFPKHKMGSF